MNKDDTNITLSSYSNDVTVHFYENAAFMESVGKGFGIDVNKDYLLTISFLYPSDMIIAYEDKHVLVELLIPIVAYDPLNKSVDSPQFITCDKEIALFLTAHAKEELLSTSTMVRDKALELLKRSLPNVLIRIGIGTLENGLTGIEHTYQNNLRAINTGEKFRKEHRVLDFIGMEIYSVANAMILTHGQSLISTILLQLTDEE